ncbi:MAG: inositol monophosphatase [Planctomycetota bacterium]
MKDLDLDSLFEAAELAVEDALDSTNLGDAVVLMASGRDIKTTADFDLEHVIISRLSTTNIPIIAEETRASNRLQPGLNWIIDPLDGTANFNRGFPFAAISIALFDGEKPMFGIIHDLFHNQRYIGRCFGAHQSSQKDGKTVRVSEIAEFQNAVLSTGFPTNRSYDYQDLNSTVARFVQYKKIRMIGSASLSLASVAEGTFDVHFEEGTMIWDIAAGLAIVQAAGGSFQLFPSGQENQFDVVATNGVLPISDVYCKD